MLLPEEGTEEVEEGEADEGAGLTELRRDDSCVARGRVAALFYHRLTFWFTERERDRERERRERESTNELLRQLSWLG